MLGRPCAANVVLALVLVPAVALAAPPEGPHNRPIVAPGEPVPLPPPAEAHCTIQVEGIGAVDTETDYLPHVITCENGGANLEALKAQAIAARSVAYYAMEKSGSICDGTGCQVYTCGATPQAVHYQAVEETSGMYLRYNGNLTYGFYVAGDPNTAAPSCVGNDANASTEQYVTYNEGKTGTAVEQTTLGWVFDPQDAGYGQNRGCMSQWGSRCLENDKGYDYVQILQFYYGADIEIVQAPGPCVMGGGGTTTGGGTTGAGTSTGGGAATGGGAGTAGGSTDGVPTTGAGTVSSDSGGGTFGDSGSTGGATEGGTDGGGGGGALPGDYGRGTTSGCACAVPPPGGRIPWALVPTCLVWGIARRRPR